MALIPPDYLDCVVAIGIKKPDDSKTWIGTGFLVGRLFKKREDNIKEYHVFLVTNKHVLEGKKSVVVRFNPHLKSDEPAGNYDIPLLDENGNLIWTGHESEDIDIAAININPEILAKDGMRFKYFQSDTSLLDTKQMTVLGLSEGDFIYVLGYPMNIVYPERQFVIARSGSIARIQDVFEGYRNNFIIDAFVFPGNSGGPVISKPDIISIHGTKPINRAYLLGIIQSYIPYEDVAISQQTGKPRVVFQENSGLAFVIPVDFIMETIEVSFENTIFEDEKFIEKTEDEDNTS